MFLCQRANLGDLRNYKLESTWSLPNQFYSEGLQKYFLVNQICVSQCFKCKGEDKCLNKVGMQ